MLILLSPAKNLNEQRSNDRAHTTPRFLEEASELAAVARNWSDDEISQIMKVSPALAKLNRQRFAEWSEIGTCAAGLMFDGDVWRELGFSTLSDAALSEADRRLRILSGLYGLLRPMDCIRAYRMEMGRKVPGHTARTLYRFWGGKIADAVAIDAREARVDTVLNLASEEYSKAVVRAGLGNLKIVSPRFEEDRGGKRRMIAFAAKRARGAMARWVLEAGIAQAADLEKFNAGGYAFDNESSTPGRPIFVRA